MRNLASSLTLGACLMGGVIAGTAHAFDIKSSDIRNDQPLSASQVYKGFGCNGANLSPEIEWTGAPAGTRSLAVTVYDPDAPTGSGWWHWVAYDIQASARKLESGAGQAGKLPPGAKHGRNDFGTYDFGGACPPAGDKPHRYVVTVYALKIEKLDVPADASPALIGFMLNANKLGTATITANYRR